MPANPNYDALLSTTLKKYRKTLEDNVFTSRPLYGWLKSKDKMDRQDGGAAIVVPLIHALNSTAKSYSGYETLDITAQEGISAAEFPWKQFAASIAIAGIEEAKNNGDAAVLNLLEAKVMQAEETIAEKFDIMGFGDGTGNSNKDWNGLGVLVNDHTAAGALQTVGGIDCSVGSNAFWRSVVIDAAAAVRTDARWTNAYNTASVGADRPDFAITTQALFESYEAGLAPNLRFTDNKSADARFQNLLFKNIPVFWDVYCTSGSTYFLNSKYIKLTGHTGTWFRNTGFKEAVDKDARWAQILCYGNMVISNRARQAWVKNQT